MYKKLKFKKNLNLSWYIKLNIMVMSFLFVVFLIKQTNNSEFKVGLKRIFSAPAKNSNKRSAKIQIKLKKVDFNK